MGAVYLCHNALSERLQAAVKVLKSHELGEARERFVREMEALASLTHDGIVRVLGSGEDKSAGQIWMAMEYLHGETLEAVLTRGALPREEALRVFQLIVEALAHAHERGVRHRDVKPANIMVLPDKRVKVLDFGIADQAGRTRLTNDRTVPGTLPYIPPEIFEGLRPNPVLADVYASGLLLYEMLTGLRVFPEDPELSAGQRMARIMAAKLTSGPIDPKDKVEPATRQLIVWATRPRPEDRLPDMLLLVAGVKAIRGGATHELPPLAHPEREPVVPPSADAPPAPVVRAAADTAWVDLDAPAPPADDPPSEPAASVPASKAPMLGLIAAGAALSLGLALVGVWALAPGPAEVDPLPVDSEPEVELPPVGKPGYALEAFRYKMVRIEPREFWMGAQDRDPDRFSEEVRHPVKLTRPFLLGATEVTQEMFRHLTLANPVDGGTFDKNQYECKKWGLGDELPVHCVTFSEVLQAMNSLSQLEGLKPAYTWHDGQPVWDRTANGYRLPTEAEWELAALAGQDGRFAGATGDADVCAVANIGNRSTKDKYSNWFTWLPFECEDGLRELAPPGKLRPNAYGLYDMSGNIGEWVWDWHAPYGDPTALSFDPIGPETGEVRIARGGAWFDGPQKGRATYRRKSEPTERFPGVGLRLARNAD